MADVKLTSGVAGLVTTPGDTDHYPITDNSGAATLKKISHANLKAAIAAYYKSIHAPIVGFTAEEITPTSSSPCGAAATYDGSVETPGTDFRYLPFDATSNEYAFVQFFLPGDYSTDTTVTAQFVWTHPAATCDFGVVWQARLENYNDNSDFPSLGLDAGTAQLIADTGGSTYRVYVTSATPAITINRGGIGGNTQAGDLCIMTINRVPGNASDTLAEDAWLLGVKIIYTRD